MNNNRGLRGLNINTPKLADTRASPAAGCDTLDEALFFKVMRLDSEPAPRAKRRDLLAPDEDGTV